MNLSEFLLHYKNGQRNFIGLDLDDHDFHALDLSDAVFEECYFHSTSWVGSNLQNTRFKNCSLKCADFRNTNLTNAAIQDCLVDSIAFNGAITKDFVFSGNDFYGATVDQKDFEETFKDEDRK
ncbi:pentapeptide repeat-containing protein [Chitinophaga caseinilytica]|uniref:Pentapeptide repeat-containing protein n=1 Tax=Chitinophaga caseinilytica TaxID=2267521 RepID=A0ABZ2Z7K7_9BACT